MSQIHSILEHVYSRVPEYIQTRLDDITKQEDYIDFLFSVKEDTQCIRVFPEMTYRLLSWIKHEDAIILHNEDGYCINIARVRGVVQFNLIKYSNSSHVIPNLSDDRIHFIFSVDIDNVLLPHKVNNVKALGSLIGVLSTYPEIKAKFLYLIDLLGIAYHTNNDINLYDVSIKKTIQLVIEDIDMATGNKYCYEEEDQRYYDIIDSLVTFDSSTDDFVALLNECLQYKGIYMVDIPFAVRSQMPDVYLPLWEDDTTEVIVCCEKDVITLTMRQQGRMVFESAIGVTAPAYTPQYLDVNIYEFKLLTPYQRELFTRYIWIFSFGVLRKSGDTVHLGWIDTELGLFNVVPVIDDVNLLDNEE